MTQKHHKFIEFFDVRDAEKAMRYLNRTELPGNKGKKIKIEPSKPGGARRSMMYRHSPPMMSSNRDFVDTSPSLSSTSPSGHWDNNSYHASTASAPSYYYPGHQHSGFYTQSHVKEQAGSSRDFYNMQQYHAHGRIAQTDLQTNMY